MTQCVKASVLQRGDGAGRLATMPKKSHQLRIPDDLALDIATIGLARGESIPEYAERVLRQQVAKDLPKAVETIAHRAKSGRSEAGDN